APAPAPAPSAAADAAGSPTPPAAAAAPAKPATPKVAPPPPPPEPGFFEQLLDNPLLLGGLAIVLLLLGFLAYRARRRKTADAGDSAFPESRLPRDSFFGATGGESVDTKSRHSSSMASSLSYSPSQLDAGDVDPVAEADVYLAYGRDLQAEEILREALRTTPERTAIHLKLLEIHTKRRDLRAFEALARDVHKLTGGSGADWSRVMDMGRELDPGNPLYQGGAAAMVDAEKPLPPAGGAGTASAAAAIATDAAAAFAEARAAEPPPPFVPSVAPLDFDLDLARPSGTTPLGAASTGPAPVDAKAPGLSAALRDAPHAAPPVPTPSPAAAAVYAPTARAPLPGSGLLPPLDNDFDTAPAALEAPRATLDDNEHTHPATLRAGLPGDSGFIEFNLSTLASIESKDGGATRPGRLESAPRGGEPDDGAGDHPHAIKLSLARELQALGDTEGARSLVEEVAGESSGDLRRQAEQLLTQLH
ncbi:MAG: FimV/HubP family polar landmark protein, partial [Xenophilus sp.]